MKTLVLPQDVRALTATPHNSLSHLDPKIFRKGEEIRVEEVGEKAYDHRDQKVLQVVGENPERFIIESEL